MVFPALECYRVIFPTHTFKVLHANMAHALWISLTNSMVDYMLEVFFIVVKYTKHKILCVYFSVIKCIHTVIKA